MSLLIRPVGISDLSACHAHLYRHSLENGRDGNLIHAPFAGPRDVTLEEFSKGLTETLQKASSELGWERQWGLFDGSEIRGTIQLRQAPRVEASLHRALMAMGIENDFRGQGWGGRLLQTALDWARAETALAWVDLGVFEHNAPARALYRKFGFKEVGRREDLFRVHGVKITDIEMVLELPGAAPIPSVERTGS